jgi:hypothetical protein
MSRRTLLAQAAVIGAAASLAVSLRSPSAAAEPAADELEEAIRRLRERHDRVLTGKPSHNGWEMEKVADDRGHIHTRPVPGTPLVGVQMRMGDLETVLVHVIRRFHRDVDELRDGDVVGWRPPATVRTWLPESNQASGTAVQIRPDHYPAGARGGFFPLQQAAIRDILAEFGGVVRWGGDDRAVAEALFYLDVGPGDDRTTKAAISTRRPG